jgi:hypothetical protein
MRIIDFHKGNFEMQWAVPYYDHKTETIDFVAWNESSNTPCDVMVIINNDNLIKFDSLGKFNWSIKTLGNVNEIHNIKILINDKLKNSITLNKKNIEMFKKTNFVKYT